MSSFYCVPKDPVIVPSWRAVGRVLAKVLRLPSADSRNCLVSFIMVSCPMVGIMLLQCFEMWECQLMEYLANEMSELRGSLAKERSHKRRKM